GLALWLGAAFAEHSTRVLQWLAIGILFNSLAQIPFAFVQGAARPDLTAKLHLIEFPLYVILLIWLVTSVGIAGAAVAWAARAGVDMLVLFWIAFRISGTGRESQVRMAIMIGISFAALVFVQLPTTAAVAMILLALFLIAFALVAWFGILSPKEREVGRRRLSFIRQRTT